MTSPQIYDLYAYSVASGSENIGKLLENSFCPSKLPRTTRDLTGLMSQRSLQHGTGAKCEPTCGESRVGKAANRPTHQPPGLGD